MRIFQEILKRINTQIGKKVLKYQMKLWDFEMSKKSGSELSYCDLQLVMKELLNHSTEKKDAHFFQKVLDESMTPEVIMASGFFDPFVVNTEYFELEECLLKPI